MIGRYISPIFSLVLRLSALAFVWGVTLAVLINLKSASMIGGVNGVSGYVVAAAIALMIPSAFFISSRILRVQFADSDTVRQPPSTQTQTRPSADSLSMRDLMALLDDDDLADLRGEIRENLRARIQRLSGADEESFEDLLADAGGKRKRGGR